MKKIFFNLLYILGLPRFAAWWHRTRVVFLCYHGVTSRCDHSDADPKGLHVDYRRFASHLDYLKRHYNVVSLKDYLNARAEGRRLAKYSLVLTFDDGFRNFFTVAAPILAQYGMPATVFLITGKTSEVGPSKDANWSPDDDRSHLSWEEVHQLERQQKVDFGSHTCSHPRLLGLSEEEVERELCDSRAELVSHVKQQTATLSYPKGEYSEMIAERARGAGYACAVTTDWGETQDLFTLGRVLIGNHDDKASLAVRVSGLRWWLVNLLVVPRLLIRKAQVGRETIQLPSSLDESAKFGTTFIP